MGKKKQKPEEEIDLPSPKSKDLCFYAPCKAKLGVLGVECYCCNQKFCIEHCQIELHECAQRHKAGVPGLPHTYPQYKEAMAAEKAEERKKLVRKIQEKRRRGHF